MGEERVLFTSFWEMNKSHFYHSRRKTFSFQIVIEREFVLFFSCCEDFFFALKLTWIYGSSLFELWWYSNRYYSHDQHYHHRDSKPIILKTKHFSTASSVLVETLCLLRWSTFEILIFIWAYESVIGTRGKNC